MTEEPRTRHTQSLPTTHTTQAEKGETEIQFQFSFSYIGFYYIKFTLFYFGGSRVLNNERTFMSLCTDTREFRHLDKFLKNLEKREI